MARAGTGPLPRAGAAFLTSYRHVRPEVTGDDLLKLGFRPGPGLHKALDVLRRARLDGLVGSRDEEKEYVRLYLTGTDADDLVPDSPGGGGASAGAAGPGGSKGTKGTKATKGSETSEPDGTAGAARPDGQAGVGEDDPLSGLEGGGI
jgi:hypothetical protein